MITVVLLTATLFGTYVLLLWFVAKIGRWGRPARAGEELKEALLAFLSLAI